MSAHQTFESYLALIDKENAKMFDVISNAFIYKFYKFRA